MHQGCGCQKQNKKVIASAYRMYKISLRCVIQNIVVLCYYLLFSQFRIDGRGPVTLRYSNQYYYYHYENNHNFILGLFCHYNRSLLYIPESDRTAAVNASPSLCARQSSCIIIVANETYFSGQRGLLQWPKRSIIVMYMLRLYMSWLYQYYIIIFYYIFV